MNSKDTRHIPARLALLTELWPTEPDLPTLMRQINRLPGPHWSEKTCRKYAGHLKIRRPEGCRGRPKQDLGVRMGSIDEQDDGYDVALTQACVVFDDDPRAPTSEPLWHHGRICA